MAGRGVTEYVWGVDPAVGRVAFAFAPLWEGALTVDTLDLSTDLREGERLGLIASHIRAFARVAKAEFPPAVVWIEQPSGRFRAPQLLYATGVIQAALHEVLKVPVWTISSSDWKRRTIGNGAAGKPAIAAWVERQGADFACQDEADAYCIARAGRDLLRTSDYEAAA